MSDIDQRPDTIVLPQGSTPAEAPLASNASVKNPMIAEINIRVPLNIAIPILALLGIAVCVLLVGLFLLRLPHAYAPAVALALSVNILAAATFAASRKELGARTVAELGVMIVYPVLLAVVLVNLGGFGHIEEASAEGAPAAGAETVAGTGPAAETVSIAAENMQFTTDELVFPADQEVALEFDNPDVAPHNVAIYEDDSLENELFIGDNVEPGGSTVYEVPPLEPGAYFFRCDIHPNMAGRVLVE